MLHRLETRLPFQPPDDPSQGRRQQPDRFVEGLIIFVVVMGGQQGHGTSEIFLSHGTGLHFAMDASASWLYFIDLSQRGADRKSDVDAPRIDPTGRKR
jgi:hypothetical protein